MAGELSVGDAAIDARLDVIGLERQRRIVGGDRVVVAGETLQHPPAPDQGVEQAGLARERGVVAGERIVEPSQRRQRSRPRGVDAAEPPSSARARS